jgi:hypothetical protein
MLLQLFNIFYKFLNLFSQYAGDGISTFYLYCLTLSHFSSRRYLYQPPISYCIFFAADSRPIFIRPWRCYIPTSIYIEEIAIASNSVFLIMIEILCIWIIQ